MRHTVKWIFALFAAATAQIALAAPPKYDHVVIVVMENKENVQVLGSGAAPYMDSLAAQGVIFNQAFAITHPSQPNYLALFSGDTQGVTDDSCPQDLGNIANLGAALITAGYSFTGYAENLPSDGATDCWSSDRLYARKHAPWVDFSNVPTTSSLMFSEFPTDFTQLPTVSFVIPNMCDDMHDCDVGTGDSWLQNNMDAYAQWAQTHNSLLIVTFDEDDSATSANQIPMFWVGQGIAPGTQSNTPANHYNVLRTLLDMYGLAPFANAANVSAISDPWSATPSPTP
ncbi:alkaline phosphatase family protein [Dyella flagellata]|uniref:Acid phosphatase n=1 Tax=Dyella flagellata TaxID=1867833 RepID=A0ABQ5XIC2_9GAMM|nr:alkaline phosphatase family protein [Dyella flagellata]GLQ90366.1 acid phosphatase [Dyella flagellata]